MESLLFTNGEGSVPNKNQPSDNLRDVNLDTVVI
jgi:hypothetical protein